MVLGAVIVAGAIACTEGLARSLAPGSGGNSGGGTGSGFGGGSGGAVQPGPGFISASRLAALQSAVRSNNPAVPWTTLRAACEQLVDSSPHPDANFFPGTAYTSTGPVPNPAGQQVQADFGHDSRTAFNEALCFRLTPDSSRRLAYATTAERFIGGWVQRGFTNVANNANVNLAFAQGFGPMTVAADLLSDDGRWDPRPFRNYLVNVALAHNSPDSATNNLGSWDLMARTLIGAYVNNAAMVDSMRRRWLFLADTQIASDGSLRFEICRSNTTNWCGDPNKGIDGLAYSNFDLGPLAIAAEVFAHWGVSVWGTSQGARVGLAYATIAHWTLHPETSPFYAHNGGSLTASQPPNFYVIFQRHYPSSDGAAVYAQNASKAWAVPYWANLIYGVNVAD